MFKVLDDLINKIYSKHQKPSLKLKRPFAPSAETGISPRLLERLEPDVNPISSPTRSGDKVREILTSINRRRPSPWELECNQEIRKESNRRTRHLHGQEGKCIYTGAPA
jgi:hypothetical protein